MFLIKEKWHLKTFGPEGESPESANVEEYENERKTQKEVEKYIDGWIEGWEDVCKENELTMEVDRGTMSATVKMSDGGVMKLWVEEKK